MIVWPPINPAECREDGLSPYYELNFDPGDQPLPVPSLKPLWLPGIPTDPYSRAFEAVEGPDA